MTNRRVYQVSVYREWPSVKFVHRHSFASSDSAVFIFSHAVFHAAPQLTEHLEEATTLITESTVPLMHYDPSNLGSLILIPITPKGTCP